MAVQTSSASVPFDAAPLAPRLLDAAEAARLDAGCPPRRKAPRLALVALADGLWLDLAAPQGRDESVVDLILAVQTVGLGEVRTVLQRREDAGALTLKPGDDPLDAIDAALGAAALRAIRAYQALVARALQGAAPKPGLDLHVEARERDRMPMLRCGRRSVAVLPETAEGRDAARALHAALGRIRRLHPDGRLAFASPALSRPALERLSPEEIAARLAAAGLDRLPAPDFHAPPRRKAA